MLVSKESFKIIDPIITSEQFKEKKLYPLMFAFGFSFVTVITILFFYSFSKIPKNKKNQEYIDGIKRALFRL